MGCNLLIYGVYWGYNPLTNHLLTSWDIQVPLTVYLEDRAPGRTDTWLATMVSIFSSPIPGVGLDPLQMA